MGFWSRTFTWWNGATWGTALTTRRFGSEVGRDDAGNIYYQDKKRPRLPQPDHGCSFTGVAAGDTERPSAA